MEIVLEPWPLSACVRMDIEHDAAAASTLTSKYAGYKSDRVKGAVEAIYAELKGTR